MTTPRKRRGDCTIYDFDPEAKKLKEEDERFHLQELDLLADAMRDGSLWEKLEGSQRTKLYQWLFEENLTYAKAAERVTSEFGLETSVSSIGRMFRCLARTKLRIELLDAESCTDLSGKMPGNTVKMREATMKLLSAQAVRRASEKPESLDDLLPLAKVLLADQENEIRLRRVKLEEDTFEFEAAMARGGEIEKVKNYLKQIEHNPTMHPGQKAAEVKAVREFLFGPDEPESAEDADESGKGESASGSSD